MATWSVRVTLVLIALFRGLLSQSSYFYPYGTAVGDTQHPAVDDACMVTHSDPLSVFTFYICTNGIISLDGSYTSYTPLSFPLSTGVTIIAPFWADADLASGGALWSRETNSYALLNNVSSIVSNVYGTSFTAVWSLVVTWENVIAFGSSNHSLTNSFQCVLVTDGFSTYAMYLYGDIEWTYGSASSSIPAQVGFDAGDGENFYAVPDSRTSAIIDIELDSNIGRRGQWMFRLDNSVIQTPAPITTALPTTTTTLPTTSTQTLTTTTPTSTRKTSTTNTTTATSIPATTSTSTTVSSATTTLPVTTSSRLATDITPITLSSTTTTNKKLSIQEKIIQDVEKAAPIASPLFALLIFLCLLLLIRKWKKSHNMKIDIEEGYEEEISSQAPRNHNWHAHLFISPEVTKSLAPVSHCRHANNPSFSYSLPYAGQPLHQTKLHLHVDSKVSPSENNIDAFQSLPPVHHAWPERFLSLPTSNLEYVQTNCNSQPKGISVIQEHLVPHLLKDSHILAASKPVLKLGWMEHQYETLPTESHETDLNHLQVGLGEGKSSVTPQIISTKHSLSGTIDDAVEAIPDQTVRNPRRGKELPAIGSLDMRVSVTNMAAESDSIQECVPGSENTEEITNKTRKNKQKGKKQKKQSTEALIEPVELMESFTIHNETETDYRAENPKSVRPKKAIRKKRKDIQMPITNTLAELDCL